MFCLVKDGKAIESDTLWGLAVQLGASLNYIDRLLLINGRIGTIRYEQNGDDEWFAREAAKDAMQVLQGLGWRLYRSI